MSWKDLFYFTRAQTNGILVLLILILLVILAPMVYQRFRKTSVYDDSEFRAATAAFEAQLEALHAAKELERQNRMTRNYQADPEPIQLNPHPFNPNQLPAADWERMGIPGHVVRSIKNYESAGGQFRFKEDVSRLYLLNDEMYRQLEPYILLPSKASQSPEQYVSERLAAGASLTEESFFQQINLNTADTTELIKLYGIGPVFSKRIVGYREKLGGFVSVEQLLEVNGMDSMRLAGFRKNLLLDTSEIRKININRAEWAELVRHPYINSNLANSLVAIRRQHGPYPSVEHIRRSVLVTDEIYTKIAPYLSIE